MDWL